MSPLCGSSAALARVTVRCGLAVFSGLFLQAPRPPKRK
jgi:hypothetical protein